MFGPPLQGRYHRGGLRESCSLKNPVGQQQREGKALLGAVTLRRLATVRYQGRCASLRADRRSSFLPTLIPEAFSVRSGTVLSETDVPCPPPSCGTSGHRNYTVKDGAWLPVTFVAFVRSLSPYMLEPETFWSHSHRARLD
ncbi:hypothetical protein AAFF_G00195440 [Aldrovandia affinis]|uniref:Uncharacterized protein n=1 Tax=Aldrovandia affinis TaxID=143900 RepID=A0AAD7RIV8_9TELE|nr:hypothetical protein AAFF_G00195440 [Aldrovandia affinis]